MFSINYMFKTILFTNAVSNTFVIFMKYTCLIFQNLKYFHSRSRRFLVSHCTLLYSTTFFIALQILRKCPLQYPFQIIRSQPQQDINSSWNYAASNLLDHEIMIYWNSIGLQIFYKDATNSMKYDFSD